MTFRVSVITPVYNAERYVEQAVTSAAELPQVDEILLINDFGPDNSWEVCRKLAGKFRQVRLLEHPDKHNHGAAASRNLGIRESRCDFIAFLDADDWYLPDRFVADEQILMSDSSIDGVYNALGNYYESESLRSMWLSQGRPDVMTLSAVVPSEELARVLLHNHPFVVGEFSTDTITVRKRFFASCGYFHTSLKLQQDTHLWKRMSVAGRLAAGNITAPVAVRRVHPENRMTRVGDHAQYMDLWFDSLFTEFRRLKAGVAEMQALRYLYCLHLAEKNERFAALKTVVTFCLMSPRVVTEEYGRFDQLLRTVFPNSGAINRLLAVKNRAVHLFFRNQVV